VGLDAAHACVVDLDGVVWLSGEALEGAAEGVALLREHGVPVLFATNNAAPTLGELLDRLASIGIDAVPEELATSAQSAAALVGPGTRALALGADGLTEALTAGGITLADERVDAVVVGLTTRFDYGALDRAAALVRGGARFVATNTHPTLPTAEGLRPGAGALVAAVAVAAGATPEVAGKPSAAMAALVGRRVRPGAVVGDRTSTDGELARQLGVPFAHVASGVGEAPGRADVAARTLLEAVRGLLGADA
jgi:glycerol 3-phosphatase-2